MDVLPKKCLFRRLFILYPIVNMKKFQVLLIPVFLFFACNKNEEGDILANLDLPDDVSFTYLPTDLTKMQTFDAIGQIQGIPKAHGGFGLKTISYTSSDIPVYAMSDGIIYNIRFESKTFESWAPPEYAGKEYDDFALEIALTKTAKMHYGHLQRLAPEILQEQRCIIYSHRFFLILLQKKGSEEEMRQVDGFCGFI